MRRDPLVRACQTRAPRHGGAGAQVSVSVTRSSLLGDLAALDDLGVELVPVLDVVEHLVLVDLDRLEAGQLVLGAGDGADAVLVGDVLLAIGRTPAEANSSLRLTLGRSTSSADIEAVLKALPPIIERLRQF